MAGQRCQVCGGKVVNGRCSLCGMPYRNDVRDMMRQYGQDADQTTQHNGNVNRNTNANRNTNINRNTNASRNTDLNRNLTGSRNTGTAAGRKTAAAVNTRNKTTVGRNRAEVLDQGKKQQKKDQKNSGAGWIIWIIVTLAILFPKLWDFLADWIGTNL